MTSKTWIPAVVALAICLTLTTNVYSATIPFGSQGFVALGPDTANTGDILNSTIFILGDVRSTASQMGIFSGMPSQSFGTVTFDTISPTSFTFSNSVFGTFDSTSITKLAGHIGPTGASQTFAITGNWTPGSFFPGVTGGVTHVKLALSQSPAHTGAISASFTLSTIVPEPSTLLTFGTGVLGLIGMMRRKLRLGT